MTTEREGKKGKNNLFELETKFAEKRSPEKGRSSLPLFLREAAPLINGLLPDYTGHVTLHIEDGELTSWNSKARGHYKD